MAAPVLPGAMFMLAYYNGDIPVMGLPGCVMYAKRTIFDLVLPRVLCNEKLKAGDLSRLGQGGLCLSCPTCTFPNCGFGKRSVIDEGSIWQGDRLPGSGGILKLCLNYESDRNIKALMRNRADDARLKE